jgi:hypothetical protein
VLADKASAPNAEQEPTAGPPGSGALPPEGSSPPAPAPAACANCGAPMDAGQEWCLSCGAGAPGSLRTGGAGWRSGAGVLAATAVLALGAAAAAYAALSKGKTPAHVLTTTVAQSPAAPGASTPATPAPITPGVGTPTTIKPLVPGAVKPPKIPLKAVTPKPLNITPIKPPAVGGAPGGTTSTPSESGGATGSGETQPGAILLDTNAANTYNPYAYAASDFGDPSLTIDGDTSTAWTAQVDASVAPKMAEGVVLDLKSPRKLSALGLTTSTPGMTIQVYGANGATPPTSITDPAWVKLSPNVVEKSKHVRLKLQAPKKAFRFVTLWISKAPAASIGTPQAPGHVSLNEVEVFPAA